MSTTVTSTDNPPKTIRLTNGKDFTFVSNAATTEELIPIIDVSRMHNPDLADRQALAEEIREAAHSIGFFCITNHGIDMNLASNVMEQAREFFALPEEKKMEVSSELIPGEYCGYHGMQRYNPNGWKYRGMVQFLAYASAWASRYGNFAGGIANLVAYLDVLPRQSKLDPSSGRFQNMSLLASVALLVTTSISCYGRGTNRDERPFPGDGSEMSLTELWETLFKAKSQVRTICLVQVFAWMAWFPFLFYTTTWINQLQHQELIRAGFPSSIIDHSDSRRGLLAYSVFGFASLASAIVIPPLVTQWELITMRKLWMIANGILAMSLVSISFTSASTPLVFLCGAVGFSWAVSSWVPYVLLAAETSLPVDEPGREEYALAPSPAPFPDHDCAERREASSERSNNDNKDRKDISKYAGLLYGIHNLAISFPQIVFSLIIGLEGLASGRDHSRDHAEIDSGEALGWIFAVAGVSATGAIYVVRGIRED